MKRFKIKPSGWHFYVMSKTQPLVWLVAIVAHAGKPGRVIAIEGTYEADEQGEFQFYTTTDMFKRQRGEDCAKGLLTAKVINAALDTLQGRMDGIDTPRGEEWQRL